MNRLLALFILCLPTYLLSADVLNITSFGASTSASVSTNTAAIQATIDSATINGDTVLVPSGTFTTGTLILKSHITLMIEGTLKGSGSLSDYPEITASYRSYADTYPQRSLLFADSVQHVTLTGGGTIDGNGASLDFFVNNDDRPFGMRFISSSNITIENLNLQSSAFWMMHNLNTDTLTIRNLEIFNHANANNDGINMDGCRNVYVGYCNVDSGDDPIVMKGMSLAIMENVVIEYCTVATYSRAIKIGTETNGGFRNIHVHDITVERTNFSIPGVPALARTGINLSIVDGGFMENVIVERVDMVSISTPIFVRLGNRARQFNPNVPVAGVGSINNVIIRDITAVAEENITSIVSGIPGHYVTGLTLENIEITVPGGMDAFWPGFVLPEEETGKPESDMFGDSIPAYGLFVRHADSLTINNFCVQTVAPDGRPFMIFEDVINSAKYEGVDAGTKTCFQIASGVGEELNAEVQVYPNPASDVLIISGSSKGEIQYVITDLLGRRVMSGTLNDTGIDVSGLDMGLYAILLTVEGQTASRLFQVVR